jgi:DedD protein
MYNFVFDKRSLTMLLAGLGVAGGLLFFAGLLVGVNLGLPGLRMEVASAPRPLPVRASARPCPEPVVPAETRTAPISPISPISAPAVEPPVQKEPPPAPLPPPQVAAEEPPPPPPVKEREPQIAEAAHRPDAGPGVFSVQVGAFRVKQNSDAVMEQLKSRGYEPYVETSGSLRIVRVGRYAEREEALRIAAALKSANMEAVVRQVKQL